MLWRHNRIFGWGANRNVPVRRGTWYYVVITGTLLYIVITQNNILKLYQIYIKSTSEFWELLELSKLCGIYENYDRNFFWTSLFRRNKLEAKMRWKQNRIFDSESNKKNIYIQVDIHSKSCSCSLINNTTWKPLKISLNIKKPENYIRNFLQTSLFRRNKLEAKMW